MNMGLHVIQFPSGRWGYVGTVPNVIYFVDGTTDEQIEKGMRCSKLMPGRRTFETKDSAIEYAESKGYTVVK